MDQPKVCAFCRHTGKRGAEWVLYIGTNSHFVHKPCGEKLKATAPEGAQVRLMPGKELAQKFRANSFWKENFRGKPTARVETTTKSPVETQASV